jgi:hypothetical protein
MKAAKRASIRASIASVLASRAAAKRQAELGRHPHQGALIAASRFADHGAAALRPGPSQNFGDGGDRVGDPQGAARRIGDVEPILRNIDADAQGACNSGKIG